MYNIQGFLDKNRDTLFQDFKRLLFNSSNSDINDMWPEGSQHITKVTQASTLHWPFQHWTVILCIHTIASVQAPWNEYTLFFRERRNNANAKKCTSLHSCQGDYLLCLCKDHSHHSCHVLHLFCSCHLRTRHFNCAMGALCSVPTKENTWFAHVRGSSSLHPC